MRYVIVKLLTGAIPTKYRADPTGMAGHASPLFRPVPNMSTPVATIVQALNT
jgi:hypothetical protein